MATRTGLMGVQQMGLTGLPHSDNKMLHTNTNLDRSVHRMTDGSTYLFPLSPCNKLLPTNYGGLSPSSMHYQSIYILIKHVTS